MRIIHIYGDNILECEESLRILEKAADSTSTLISSPLYAPKYLISNSQISLTIELFPGYGRWSYDVQTQMRILGAKLREAPDAIITEVIKDKEIPLIAFEFSGALPAGNNAWQRCGRALACAQAKIPYIYVAELGGIELDSERNDKAGRLPNPIIPFAYYTLSSTFTSPSIVLYLPSPTISEKLQNNYLEAFSTDEIYKIVHDVLFHSDFYNGTAFLSLKAKAKYAAQKLAQSRKVSKNSISSNDWETLTKLESGSEKAIWLGKKKMPWKKKVSIDTTASFKLLQGLLEQTAYGVTAVDLPFGVIPSEKRSEFSENIIKIYNRKITKGFTEWLIRTDKALVVILIAGFKPRGDDSRPDRGLAPLVRMVFGNDVDILSIVYGPGKNQMWEQLNRSMWSLAGQNGLWEAIINLSDAVLVDSPTCNLENIGFIVTPQPEKIIKDQFPMQIAKPNKFGEHDIDTVLHTIFSSVSSDLAYECLCNPPGGNWSGISIFERNQNIEMRWSSLPRVSGENAKRPDHIFQINHLLEPETLFIIESKENGKSVEDKIGERLILYVSDLISISPNISRAQNQSWTVKKINYLKPKFTFVSCCAFEFRSNQELVSVHERTKVTTTIGVEFEKSGKVVIHIKSDQKLNWLIEIMKKAKEVFGNQIDVKWL